MCILIWIGRKRPVTCTIMGVLWWIGPFPLLWNPDPVASPGATWLADADSLETECRMDRIDFIYYQGKTIQAIASECYDNSLGKTFTFKGEDFFYPSDHGFVLSKFELK